MLSRLLLCCLMLLALVVVISAWTEPPDARNVVPATRREVVFWHFWGGEDRTVVEAVVDRFNASQDEHFVRAIAMPGNNLDMKLFMAITGGDPPDVINQDDPIMADWAERGALLPLDEVASDSEIDALQKWLVPAANRLGTYRGRMYALCNGLDIRALYYNKTVLDQYGLQPPKSIDDLDEIAAATTVIQPDGRVVRFGYLPDARRLWAWGIVFGGEFDDDETGEVTLASRPIVEALAWMVSYRDRYGAAEVAAFRQGDQSLPGKTFPLLAGRYTMLMDGQWRVRDIVAAQREQRRAGQVVVEYGVCPLPFPPAGRPRAGWVNGNFFLVPRGAKNPAGAWEFMKFWSGFGGHEANAAQTCVAGGWIPVSTAVADQPTFRDYLQREPLFATFVELAAEPHQIPTPVMPGAAYFQRTVNDAAATAMYVEAAPDAKQLLEQAASRIQAHLDRNASRGER
ncbi:MAG: ABC transporter substrate-binding protein [Planctomycetota bacterium]|nr:ABC transporter substrate-binding protein [Planctomycetota bacterium]